MTELEHQVMQFEDQWWRLSGSKEARIRDELGMSATRYYQLLHALVQRDDVLAAYPVLTKRLRRRMSRTPTRPRVGTFNLD